MFQHQPADLLWRRLRKVDDKLGEALQAYAQETFGPEGFIEALGEFFLYPDETYLERSVATFGPLFFAWYFYNWTNDPEVSERDVPGPRNITIAESYCQAMNDKIDPLAKRFIAAAANRPYSFYEVLVPKPGIGFRLKDVLLGKEYEVLEHLASEHARQGDIYFARLAQIDHVNMIVGLGAFSVPPVRKTTLIDFRNWLREESLGELSTETLAEYELDLRELYFDICAEMDQLPEMRNSDGDPILFHTVQYTIDSPGAVFEDLQSLARGESGLIQMSRNKEGVIKSVEIQWIRPDSDGKDKDGFTILGSLWIEGNQLKADVNSIERSTLVQKEIEERLGDRACYQTTVVQSVEGMLKQPMPDTPPDLHSTEPESPEVREIIDQTLQAHWRGWVDDKIPALGDLTPRQAAATSEGREKLRAVLNQFEHNIEDHGEGGMKWTHLKWVRGELGLE